MASPYFLRSIIGDRTLEQDASGGTTTSPYSLDLCLPSAPAEGAGQPVFRSLEYLEAIEREIRHEDRRYDDEVDLQ